MLECNLCYTTFVLPSRGAPPGRLTKKIEVDAKTKLTHEWVQDEEGVLPAVITALLAARGVAKKHKAEAMKANDERRRVIYHCREQALKRASNSAYGFCGARV